MESQPVTTDSLDKVLEIFTLRVENAANRIEKGIQQTKEEIRQEVQTQVQQLRNEQRRDFDKLATTVDRIADTQKQQGEDIARIDQRLDEGDKKFNQHEDRIQALESETAKQGRGMAGIAGALSAGAAVGGGLTAAVMNVLK